MKVLILFLAFYSMKASCQDLDIKIYKTDSASGTNRYTIKLFNNLKKPIAIKSSQSFIYFSEKDTLELAISKLITGDHFDYCYGIDYSTYDTLSSENQFYHTLILNPQTYLISNVSLFKVNDYKRNKIWFTLLYTTNITDDEYKMSLNSHINLTKEFRKFESKNVLLQIE